jgi:hypothetical protein
LGYQWRKIACQRLPNPVIVNVEVAVNEPVPHPYDPSPRDLGTLLLQLGGHIGGGLSNNLDAFYQPESQEIVLAQISAGLTL